MIDWRLIFQVKLHSYSPGYHGCGKASLPGAKGRRIRPHTIALCHPWEREIIVTISTRFGNWRSRWCAPELFTNFTAIHKSRIEFGQES